jgi:peptidoglycan-associated lipoprotein
MTTPARRLLLTAIHLALLVATFSACRTSYPSCERDKDCREHEFCVSRMCLQCRLTSDCPAGETCNAGKCSSIPDYCEANTDCRDGKACIQNRCAVCTDDHQCATEGVCQRGACVRGRRCSSDSDCAQNEDCSDGICTPDRPPRAAAPCTLPSVFFDFNEATLTLDARNSLAGSLQCLQQDGRAKAIGHTDPRGTNEYNLALSERRARAVREHLEQLGVPASRVSLLPRGALDAKGTDEPTWARDRRVDLQVE